MRLATFEVQTVLGRFQRIGAVTASGIVDLNFAARRLLGRKALADARVPPEMIAFLAAGEMTLAQEAVQCVLESEVTEEDQGETLVFDPAQVRLLAPLPRPASVRDFYAFEAHVKTGFAKRGEPMPQEWYEFPAYYKSGHQNIIGTEQDVPWPPFTEKFDYELELAAVIGKPGANLSVAETPGHIAGYLVMNDFSARDIQRREMKVRLGPAKGKDWCTAIGPVLVTPDEVGDPYSLRMTARVNGELWSDGNSSTIHWRFDQMIEFLTRGDHVETGDVLGSGTVGGGCGLELDRWVQPGDVMDLEIEKLGVLRNRVVRK